MTFQPEEKHSYPYYCEVEGLIEPTPEEFERGRRLAESLDGIVQSLFDLGVKDQYLKFSWNSLNRARLIVIPDFPIDRVVERGDSFYKFTSPDEKSKSAAQLVVSSFEIIKPSEKDITVPALTIEARSPHYSDSHMTLCEVSVFNPIHHQVAIRRN